jgi:tRNA A-37 threonylcarbamoyl transferase component Bud32
MAGQSVKLATRQGNHLVLNPQGLAGGTSLDVKYDAQSRTLWACHDHEVVAFAGNHWTHITPNEGLLDRICYSVAILPHDEVWVSYGVTGTISRIQPDASGRFKVTTIQPHDQPPATNVGFLDADQHGWLWRASGHGDYVATPDAAARGDWLLLDTQDGIPIPGGNQNSFSTDSDGSIWFASDNTIVHFNSPPGFASQFPAPHVFVSGFTPGSEAPSIAGSRPPVKHGQDITAYFGCLQFSRRNALRFRYRVLPEQQDWRETRDLRVALGKRKSGNHTVEMQGRLLTGEWSETQRASFTVLRPAWLSWPALLLLGAGGGTAGAGLARWRKHQQFKQQAVLPNISSWLMSARSPETDSLIGTTINGRYEIGHILSVGGFATVVRARDLLQDRQLRAIKIFRYELGDQVWLRHRFEQEVTALEQLAHPNIVRITDHGAIDTGAPYLVMEFIEGRSLRELLDEGAMPRHRTGRLLRQLVSALETLHSRAIYHRDLKPENLMIRSDGDGSEQLVLIDFSIAIVKSADHTFHGISRVAGTLGYMAPEQVIGYADASTDIYALAKILIEMLTGSPWTDLVPEGTLDMPAFVRNYLQERPFGLKPDSIDMLATALAFDPTLRPKSAAHFGESIIRDLESAS